MPRSLRKLLNFGGRVARRDKESGASSSTSPSQGNSDVTSDIPVHSATTTNATSLSNTLPPPISNSIALSTSPAHTSTDIITIPKRIKVGEDSRCERHIENRQEFGLHILVDSCCNGQPAQAPEIDVVAVHGLNFKGAPDHAWKTWTKGDKLWLRDFLPTRLPKPARVMLFAYNSRPARGAATATLEDHARTLLQWLLLRREGVGKRPLMFICHSLGGLVVKQALIQADLNPTYKSIAEDTFLLVFFATPHQGGNHASLGDIVAKIVTFGGANDILNALKQDSDQVTKRFEDARNIFSKCFAISFFETEPYGLAGIIVNKNSATLNLPDSHETSVAIPANHSTICKFDSINDPTCELVLGTIAAGVERAQNSSDVPNHVHSDEDRKCLQDLRVTDPSLDKKRIEQTKGGLLKDAYHWVLQSEEFLQWRTDKHSPLLWIKGDPGKGKTMLLCGIIDELRITTTGTSLLSYFFCQATDSRINNAYAVLRGLIYMLIVQRPALISHVRRRYDSAGKQLFEDVNAWAALTDILSSMLDDPRVQNGYFIIDALDECTIDLSLLLRLIEMLSAQRHTKWIVSSRNWPGIEKHLENSAQKTLCLELNEASVSTAVKAYVEFKVTQLARKNDYDSDTQDNVQNYLSSNAKGTFLWVALVCQELATLSGWKARKQVKAYPPGLESLYQRMYDQVSKSEEAGICTQILATVSATYRPLTLDELVLFIDLPEGVTPTQYKVIAEIIRLCGSFLTLRKDTVSFVHQSAKDFLLKDIRNVIFPSGIEGMHYVVFSKSTQAMHKILRRDIYKLKAPGFPIDNVEQPSPDPLAAIRYSCVYWVDHLYNCGINNVGKDLQDDDTVDRFLRQKYLNWLEALSLLRSISNGVLSMIKLEGLLLKPASKLSNLVQDGRRFVQYHRAAIENSPLQLYASALIFSPSQSLVRRQFQMEEPQWIITKPIMDTEWSSCITTLEGHSGTVTCIAWSTDGRLASGSHDDTIKIWDAVTGQCATTLEGHSDSVTCIAWSTDGRLASGSDDYTIKIWDAVTGQCATTLEGHSDWVRCIAWSTDGRLASGSIDDTIKIWDAATGQCTATLDIGYIYSLEFDISKPEYLYTNVGYIDLGYPYSSRLIDPTSNNLLLPRAIGYGLSKEKNWITYQGEDIIWLPPEYRPQMSAVFKENIAFSTGMERVLVLRFMPQGSIVY